MAKKIDEASDLKMTVMVHVHREKVSGDNVEKKVFLVFLAALVYPGSQETLAWYWGL